ncbi:hypothetical protein [Faecalibacterium prausnitzii]|uniref:hypothetical protein n=1 Tax=Faecalibacterium prausnitzii TaxID=853 RepID=UPI00210CA80E|nr:hypothetical protein [Faecalibacterium prausnitzii]MCQ5176250.1 hypothetical protein [Faecalibacterium prausnitzii]
MARTILNGRRALFGHLQRKIIFIFAILENLRIFQNCFFMRAKNAAARRHGCAAAL